MAEELKTSAEWERLDGIVITDPDGWDRTNYQFSFHEENITLAEYVKRRSNSTTMRTSSSKVLSDKHENG